MGQLLSSVKQEMSKGVIIHLDNDYEGVLKPSSLLFEQNTFDLDYITCRTKGEFSEAISHHKTQLRGLIFDLLSEDPSSGELHQEDAQFLDDMKDSYAYFNIPIFVYSGYLQALEGRFLDCATVFQVDKEQSIQIVFDKFRMLHDSGFIDVFRPGGILEREIKDELHKSFTKQFSNNSQIEEIISTIMSSSNHDELPTDRVKRVFKRIAIRTLASDLLAPIADSMEKVHPIEHFYKRQSKIDVWTGDIWEHKDSDLFVLILTPRCDFATGKADTIIFCIIEPLLRQISLKGSAEEIEKRIRDHLYDNLNGKSKRYILSNAFFPSGGMANLANHHTLPQSEFIQSYSYVVTLSDDLTNEIIGKFAYYFLRTGITNINEQEFELIIRALTPKEDSGKK